MIRHTVLVLFFVLSRSLFAGPEAPEIPLSDGVYVFEHRFAEQPDMPSVHFKVTIRGGRIVVVNEETSEVFPKDIIDEGVLAFHAASGQWIIAYSESDLAAEDVGGCSDGPTVVDLVRRIYWTC